MMFPAAANGHMPFVDRYREEQIRRIIAKAERQRRHSGPDRFENSPVVKVKDDRIRSMPALHGGSAAAAAERAKMRFLSTPEMSLPSDRRPQSARDASGAAASNAMLSRSGSSSAAEKPQQSSFLAGLRKLFGGGKASKAAAAAAASQSRDSTDAAGAASHRRPASSSPIGIKKASAEAGDGGAHKAKRQRTRTVSNISSVMETILEQNETVCSTEDVSCSSSSPSSSVSSGSPYSCSPATTSSAPAIAASRGLHLMESLRVNGYVFG